MFGFEWNQIAAMALLAVGGVGFLLANRGTVAGWLPKFSGGTSASLDENTLDFQALDRVQKRFARLKCKEGLDACSIQLQHFYHGEGEH